MSKVAIVTDSTSGLPQKYVDQHNITVAPQIVIWGEETLRDGVDIQPTEFYRRLASSDVLPTTSQVTIAKFKDIYSDLHSQGYDILCVLVSSKLSGTISSAVQARELVPGTNVEIVDSFSIAMALGFQVIETAKVAESGASLAECKAVAEKAVGHTGLVLTAATLKYLHRGGRIGGGQRLLGTALNIKPILELQDGRLEAGPRVRTRKKALRRLIDLVEEHVGGQTPVRLASLHANSPDDAKMLLDQATNRLNAEEAILAEVSPVVGTHTGPGLVGLTFMAGM